MKSNKRKAGKKRTIVRRIAANQQPSVRITITTTKKVHEHLTALVPLGVYGKTVAEVGERLICTQLLNDMKKTRTVLLNPDK